MGRKAREGLYVYTLRYVRTLFVIQSVAERRHMLTVHCSTHFRSIILVVF